MPSYVLDITVRATDKASGIAKGVGKEFGSLAKTVGGVLATGFVTAGAAATAFGLKAIQMGSDAAETKSKFNTVFKDMADEVGRWSDSVANSMGLTKAESKGMLASVQDLLVPFGVARDQAAGMSKQILTLAGDMASFNNLNTADVIKDINSALVGSTEPMNKYGVVLNVAAIEQEALTLGLIKQGDELDNVSKAQATLSLIMKSTTDAQGDLGRTQDGFANQLRATEAVWKDMVTTIGEELLPLVTPLLAWFNTWSAEMLPKFVQGTKDGIAGLKEAWNTNWGGMQTTVNTFTKDVPVALTEFWKEVNLLFNKGQEEVEVSWQEWLTIRLSEGLSGWSLAMLDTWTKTFRGFRELGAAGQALIKGDWDTFFASLYSAFENILVDPILNSIEFTFGPNFRNSIINALNGFWPLMNEWATNLTNWWNEFWAKFTLPGFLGGGDTSTITPPTIPTTPTTPSTPITPPTTTPTGPGGQAPGGGAWPIPPSPLTINVDARGSQNPAEVEQRAGMGVLRAARAAGIA